MVLTIDILKKLIPTNKEPEAWLDLLNSYFARYEINTPERIAAFMSQAAHESNDFRTLSENLNYSWHGLRNTFPRYFKTDEIAKQYHRQPERIANRVYDDALRVSKLGNVKPGDGWRFRGQGIFQLTGRANYAAFGKSIGKSADEAAAFIQTREGAVASACWYWQQRGLSAFADAQDAKGLSEAVNGGTIGLEARIRRFQEALTVLQSQAKPKAETKPQGLLSALASIIRKGN